MEEEIYLKDIKEGDEQVMNWKFLSGKGWRLYYRPNQDKKPLGFYFYSLEWAGNFADDPEWCPDTIIDILYAGIACFDGVRHMYLRHPKHKHSGYVNYPGLDKHIEIFQALKQLENEYCRNK